MSDVVVGAGAGRATRQGNFSFRVSEAVLGVAIHLREIRLFVQTRVGVARNGCCQEEALPLALVNFAALDRLVEVLVSVIIGAGTRRGPGAIRALNKLVVHARNRVGQLLELPANGRVVETRTSARSLLLRCRRNTVRKQFRI